ncbi:MAG TPA: hypothetical protein VKR06_46100 [Ktedonosporobacter sp.]|nr:hypothetical protein [Ktedonosporobacter sp.]
MITIVAPTQEAHTVHRPYCLLAQCWCHKSSRYHAIVVNRLCPEWERQEQIRQFIRRERGQA